MTTSLTAVAYISNNDDWIDISGNINRNSSGIWSHASFDLREYGGQTIQIAFEIDVINTNYTGSDEGPGWYIDNIEILTGAPVFNNPEGWEDGLGDWYISNGTWEVGSPTSGPGAAYEGQNCLATVLDGNYYSNAYSRAISPMIRISPAAVAPTLRFRNWYSMSGSDALYVQVRPEGEEDWTTLADGTYTGSSNTWTYTFFPLNDYVGQRIQLGFLIDANASSSSGWYIDNITINLPENFPPIINLPASFSIPQNEVTTIDLSPYIADPDEDPVTLSVSGNEQIGVEVDNLAVTFSASDNWFGTTQIIVTADDQVNAVCDIARTRPTNNRSVNQLSIDRATCRDTFMVVLDEVSIDPDEIAPRITQLFPAYPNPVNGETCISFALSEPSVVAIDIYNIRGQRIETLAGTKFEAGVHRLMWDCRDQAKRPVSSGLYLIRMKTGKYVKTQKILYLR